MDKTQAVMRLATSLQFNPAEAIGPVAAAYLVDRSSASCIMGPIGSGKTSVSLIKCLYAAAQQEPNDKGIRYSKFAVIRDTYRNLSKTTIPSWTNWVPRELGEFKGGGSGEPATHHIRFKLENDNTIVDLLMEFIAVGEHNIEDVMRGWEGSGAYLNEADRLPEDVFKFVRGRVGRYPSLPKHNVKCSWRGVWADMNAPDEDNYMAKLFIYDRPQGFAFFEQPGGLNPNAENIKNLPDRYYEDQMAGQTDYYIRRMIHNKLGYSRDGKPVYEEFNDSIHVAAQPLKPIPGLPIDIGFDGGLTPAAVIGQQLSTGHWNILAEIIADGIGAHRFAELVKRVLSTDFRGFLVRSATCDPACMSASSQAENERSWRDIMALITGLKILPAQSNAITPRLDTVKMVLSRLIDGRPGFSLSPRCMTLRRGFNSGYRFRRQANLNANVIIGDSPEKNEYSHPHDALQYLLMGAGEYREVMGRKKAPAVNRRIDRGKFKVFGG